MSSVTVAEFNEPSSSTLLPIKIVLSAILSKDIIMAGSGLSDGLNDSKPHINSTNTQADPSPRRRASKTAEYYAKTSNGDYFCILCKNLIPPREVILKKDKTGSTILLWRHLKKVHPAIHRKLHHDESQRSVGDVSNNATIQKEDFAILVVDRTVEEIINFICGTHASYDIVENPALERFLSFFAHSNVSLPCAETIKVIALKKFEEGKDFLRRLLDPVRKLSLTMDVWTNENQDSIFGVTSHWIDDTWTLCRRVLAVETMSVSHMGDDISEVLIRVRKDFNLMDKVCAVTISNPHNDITIVPLLTRLPGGYTESRLVEQYHMPCMDQILNIIVEEGLKRLDVVPAPSTMELIGKHAVDSINPTQHSKLGMLMRRLRLAILDIRGSQERINQYMDLCRELGMHNWNVPLVDIGTRWNSTYEMLVAALEKRQVFDKMADDVTSTTKNLTITSDEWELLQMLARVLLPYCDSIELLRKSSTVSASAALRIFEALLSIVDSYINDLGKLLSDTLDSTMLAALNSTYTAMKEKLIEYENSLKRNPTFAVAAALDPRMKLSYALSIEQDLVYKNLLQLLEETDDRTTLYQEETNLNSLILPSTKGAVLSRGYNIIDATMKSSQMKAKRIKRSVRDELDLYFGESCVDDDSLNWWRQTGSWRFPRLSVLAKEFLSVCAACTSLEHASAGALKISPYKEGSLDPSSSSVLMTLKCWAREEEGKDRVKEEQPGDDAL